MAQEAFEKYSIQVYRNDKWIERLSFKVDQRRAAMQEAKNMSRGLEMTPVRVMLDRFNPLNKVHTETLIFRNEVKEKVRQPVPKKPKIHRLYAASIQPVAISIWGFLGVILNVLLIGAVAGGLSTMLVELMMQGFKVRFEEEFRHGFLIAMFALVFVIAGISSYQYYMQKYVYVPWKKRYLNKQVKKITREEYREKRQKEKDLAYISKTMKTAASEIAKQPNVNCQSADDYMISDDMDDLERYRFPINSTNDVEEQPAPNPASYKLFLNTFLSDCLHGMQEHGATLTGQNRFGLMLFMKGAIGKLVERNDLSDEILDDLQSNIFNVLGLTQEEKENFLTRFPEYLELSIHRQLITKGSDALMRADKGDETTTNDMFFDLQLWLQSIKEQNEKPVFILSCEPLSEIGESDLQGFQIFSQNLIGLHEGRVLEHPRSGLVVQFDDLDKAMTTSIDLQKYCQAQGPVMHPQMSLCVKTNEMEVQQAVILACNMSLRAESHTTTISQDTFKMLDEKTPYSLSSLGQQILNEEEHAHLLYRLEWQMDMKVFKPEEPVLKDEGFEDLVLQGS